MRDEPLLIPGVKARYHPEVVPSYQGNPLIEALPPIWTEEETRDLLRYQPPYTPEMREAPTHPRYHLILSAAQFFRPLPIHLELEQRFSRMLRAGYVNRHPLTPGYWPQLTRTIDALQRRRQLGQIPHLTTTQGFSIVGMSGVGKSTSVRRILSLYDQVILHARYGRKRFTHVQVVWLLLQCPRNGALSDLVRQFFQVLDQVLGTDYYRQFVVRSKRRIEEFIPDMANLAARHSLGMLVIDEVQNLLQARGTNAEELLNFLVELDNTIGIPIVLIGTTKALPILMKEFRRARRAAGQGDLVWDRMEADAIWEQFVRTLWGYQFVRQATPLTPGLRHALYEASQGITDLAVKLYLLAQMHALASGEEVITPDLFGRVAAANLRMVQPFLAALRSNDVERLRHFDDLQPLELTMALVGSIREAYPLGEGQPSTESPERTPQATSTATAPVVPAGGDTQPARPTGPGRVRRRAHDSLSPAEEPVLVTLYETARNQRRSIYDCLQAEGFIGVPREELGLAPAAQAHGAPEEGTSHVLAQPDDGQE